MVLSPKDDPRAEIATDTRAALVYGSMPPPMPPAPLQNENGGLDLSRLWEDALASIPAPAENSDLLTITTADGEVIEIAAQIPPALINDELVRVESRDWHAEARRLEIANERARQAVAATARSLAVQNGTAPVLPVVYSTGQWVNVRSGPSTSYPVVAAMLYGMEAERLSDNINGWTQIRMLETGQEGYTASSYLTLRNP